MVIAVIAKMYAVIAFSLQLSNINFSGLVPGYICIINHGTILLTIFRQRFKTVASVSPELYLFAKCLRSGGIFNFIALCSYAEFLPALIIPKEERITSF